MMVRKLTETRQNRKQEINARRKIHAPMGKRMTNFIWDAPESVVLSLLLLLLLILLRDLINSLFLSFSVAISSALRWL